MLERNKDSGRNISAKDNWLSSSNDKHQKKKPDKHWSVGWGTCAQGTHFREGEAGHNVLLKGNTGGTQRPQTVSTKLQWIAELAAHYPERVFTSIAHLIDVEFLKAAYSQTRKDGSPGLSGTTAQDYANNLEENLQNLHERLKNGTYKASPVKRAWLDKENGKKRPIGVAEFEDKIVQRAVVMLLEVIYEQMFYDFSHGFRKRHNAHQALFELREFCMTMGLYWIVDIDICGFFDNLDRTKLRELIKRRVNDGSILQLIGKWLNAGIVEGEDLYFPGKGTVQGSVISPLLSNIYLHYVLDEWFVKEIKPHLKGHCILLRFADDFVFACEIKEEAKWIMEQLSKRLYEYGLTIHPEKSALIDFRRPDYNRKSGKGNGTFDFLGFTHYWAKSRRGFWVIKRKTARDRIRRTRLRIWKWCQYNRHKPIEEQHQILCAKLRGHYQYYAMQCNYPSLGKIYDSVKKAWLYWLRRRGGKRMPWEKFNKILETFPLPTPRIIHSF